ncbi:MAG: efflux transporter periplasmic adaptor subunit [Nevskia sp.]|nr:efflux transporter periplasmic adaptor subunit [Nevskia sp.]
MLTIEWGRLHWVVLAAFASTLLLAGCHKSAPEAPPPPTVEVAKVLERKVQDWDEYTGRLQAVDSVEIRPRVSGYIDKVAFPEGQSVKQGDLLFLIDPRPYQADFDRANAELQRSRTQLELAHVELDRVQKLKDSGAVSREEYDERLSGLHQAEANVASAKAAVDSAQLNLSFTRVTSPINGRVSRAEITRGNLVSGGLSGGTLLTTVVSIDPIYVYFDGDESAYLRYGQMARAGERPSSRDAKNPVQLSLINEEGYPHTGYMDFVDNQLNPQTGTIRARAVFDNKDGVFTPGLYARIRLLGSGEYAAILVNDSAIGTDQSQKFALVVGADNKVEYRPVKLGRLIDGLRVVREGLKPGETIVVSGLQRVHPGAPITPQASTMGVADAPPPTDAAPATGDKPG